MALDGHIEALKQKHRELDEQILKLSGSVSSGDEELASLKRQKLQLRDQIVRLESSGEAA